jgi:hypothetical protein
MGTNFLTLAREVGWVFFWSVAGCGLAVAAWPQHSRPKYREWLAITIGIYIEALGVELTRGTQAIGGLLAFTLVLAGFVRFMPGDQARLSIRLFRWTQRGAGAFKILFSLYFFIGVLVLLLAYRNELGSLIAVPRAR